MCVSMYNDNVFGFLPFFPSPLIRGETHTVVHFVSGLVQFPVCMCLFFPPYFSLRFWFCYDRTINVMLLQYASLPIRHMP